MSQQLRVWQQAELSPPKDLAFVSFLKSIATGERDWRHGGRLMIKRALTTEERRGLEQRRAELSPWVSIGDKRDKRDAVVEMLMGCGGPACSKAEAAEIATQYVSMCASLPAWAVKRACLKFSLGQVTADEVGEKTISFAYRPSTAHLHKVAALIAEDAIAEHARIQQVLTAVPAAGPSQETPEARARVLQKIEEWRHGAKARQLAEDQVREETRRESKARRWQQETERRLQEYRDEGLEPPKSKEGGVVTSLPMMLKMGWTIQVVDHRRVLVPPPRPVPPAKKERKPQEEIPF